MFKPTEPTRKELFIFASVWIVLLAGLAFYPVFKGDDPRVWAAVLCGLFVLLLFLPKQLIKIYRVWVAFGSVIGRVNSIIILYLLFYVMITPTGLIMRLFGKDPLNKKIDKTRKSYWSEHESSGSMKNQF